MARRRPGMFPLLAALAVLAVGLSQPWARDAALAPPGARASFLSGNFSYTNSAQGSAIFSTDALKPGQSVTGTVTITNTGDLTGDFELSQAALVDTPGWNGGQLAPQLDLLIQEITGAPVTIYSGKLTGMSTRKVGRIDPGEARTFRFSMGFADGGTPASNTTGDNVYQGAFASARYDWTGSQLSPAPAPGPPAPGETPPAGPGTHSPSTEPAPPDPESGLPDDAAKDTTPPHVRLKVRRKQRFRRRRSLLAVLSCNEACKLRLTPRIRRGRKKLKLRVVRRTLVAGRKTKIKLKLSRKARRALTTSKKITVVISIRAVDGAGNAADMRRRARVREVSSTKVRSGGRLRGR